MNDDMELKNQYRSSGLLVIRPTGIRKIVELAALLAIGSTLAAAQTAALSIVSGSGSPGNVVNLGLSLESTVTAPAGLEWTVSYPTADISALSVTGVSGLPIDCTTGSGTVRCVEYTDSNSNTFSNGTVATLAFTVASSASGAAAISLQNGVSVSAAGSAITTTTTGGTLTVVGPSPVITSSGSASGTVGSPFSYQITATNSPTSYGAGTLPSGLSINTSTGVISGTPTAAGTTQVTVSATNSHGTGSETVTITISSGAPSKPVITSSGSASGTVGSSFSYQITATNSPTSYSASGLPSGLSVNTSSGVISGTPTAAGTSMATVGATNSGGSGTATLTITISAQSTFSPSTMSSPTPGSTLTGSSATFQWTAGTGTAANYWLDIGTTGVGSSNVFFGNYATTSATVSGLPTSGGTLYVRIQSENASTGAWSWNDYTYTAHTNSGSTFTASTMSSPTPGSTLTGSSATFQWTAGTGTAANYWLDIGTTGVGSSNVFYGNYATTSATVSGLPTSGGTLYVRIQSENASTGAWSWNDYTYTAHSSSTGSTFSASTMTSPMPDSTLAGSTVTFQWTAGTGTAANYWIDIGTTGVGSSNVFYGNYATTSATVSGLPVSGGALYVRLYSYNQSTGTWVSNDYMYKQF
jgi:Putative Ig domain